MRDLSVRGAIVSSRSGVDEVRCDDIWAWPVARTLSASRLAAKTKLLAVWLRQSRSKRVNTKLAPYAGNVLAVPIRRTPHQEKRINAGRIP